MKFSGLKPLVRDLEPMPFVQNGAQTVLLRDPLRFSGNSIVLSPSAYWIATLMNGKNSIDAIRRAFQENFNAPLDLPDIEKLVKILDDSFFLDNDNFRKHKQAVIEEFRESGIRKSSLAGESYPDDAEEVSELLDSFLDDGAARGNPPFAIVAPHIDLHVGGPVFGKAYAGLKNSVAETFVILAIGHTLTEDFFACTNKDFQTPLGSSSIDAEFLENLEKEFGEPLFEQEFAHKAEHSAEFQVLFLQKIFGGNEAPRKIVPILFSFPEYADDLHHPRFNAEQINRFSAALRKTVEQKNGRVAVIAGIDLSHVGRRFGQAEGATPELLEQVERDDRQLLRLLADGDREDFVKFMKEVNPRNHVCGFPALYVLFDLLNGRKGELMEYRQNVEGDSDSMVSFAAMAF